MIVHNTTIAAYISAQTDLIPKFVPEAGSTRFFEFHFPDTEAVRKAYDAYHADKELQGFVNYMKSFTSRCKRMASGGMYK